MFQNVQVEHVSYTRDSTPYHVDRERYRLSAVGGGGYQIPHHRKKTLFHFSICEHSSSDLLNTPPPCSGNEPHNRAATLPRL
jgi:hypothetical protein